MRLHLFTLALVGAFGFVATSDAKACHKKACTPAPAPCVVAEPCPPPAPVCEPVAKKHCFKIKLGGHKLFKGGLCHKKAAPVCEPAPVVCEAAAAPVVYAAAQASPQASPQVHASGQ